MQQKMYAESAGEAGQLAIYQFSERKNLQTLSESCLEIKLFCFVQHWEYLVKNHLDGYQDKAEELFSGSDKMFTFCIWFPALISC